MSPRSGCRQGVSRQPGRPSKSVLCPQPVLAGSPAAPRKKCCIGGGPAGPVDSRSSASGLRRGQAELLIVDEEESFVMTIEELRYFDRPAETPAELIEDHQVAVRLKGRRIVI